MLQYTCDICGKEIVDVDDGVLHEIHEADSVYGELYGFAMYQWNDEAAASGDMGHVHKKCVPEQIDRYLKKLKWGRIEHGKGRTEIVRSLRSA